MAGAAALAMAAGTSSAADTAGDARREDRKLPRLDDLTLLRLWEQPPAEVAGLYEACYSVLSSRRTATFADVAADPAVRQLCDRHGIQHLGGPMLGQLTAEGAKVWLRTCRPAKVEVRIDVDGRQLVFGPVFSSEATDLAAIVPVTGLKPGTRYPYRVLVDGRPLAIPSHSAITTALAEPNPASVRIAFGTCAHRFGLGNRRQAETIRGRQPTAMLLCGDVAVQDRNNNLGMHRADYLLRDFYPAWQGLSAAIPVYATWDDHDYFDNDKWGIPPGYTAEDRLGVWNVFRQCWNNPAYGFDDPQGGVFFRTRIGPCDVITTDGRYFRQQGSFLGAEQMRWLQQQLLDCKGPFIILESSTMWSDYVSDGKDSWGVYDREGREQLFRFIETNRIGGVLLISGDRHGARVFRIPRSSDFAFYEFEPASLGGIYWGPPARVKTKHQLFGHLGYAFGEFTVDATLADPAVTFRLISEDSQVLYELQLTRSQLTPSAA